MTPLSVSTAETAPPLYWNPVTLTPARMRTPSPFAFSASPHIDFWLLAYPPFFSCRTDVMPCACQSPNRRFM